MTFVPPEPPPIGGPAPIEPVPLAVGQGPAAPEPPTPVAPPVAPPYPGPPAQGYPPQPYPYYVPPPPPPRGLSIASMVLSLAGFVVPYLGFLSAIAGVITGHIAVRREPAGKGFWLTGIIVGWVVIGFYLLVVGGFFVLAAVWSVHPMSPVRGA